MKRILVWVLSAALLLCVAGCDNRNTKKAMVFYANEGYNKLVNETRTIKYTDEKELYQQTISALLEGPKNADNKRVIPEGTKLLSLEEKEGTLTVNFSSEFIKTNGATEELLCRMSVISTLCSVAPDKKVHILVDGNELLSSATGNAVGAVGKEDIVYGASLEGQKNTIELTLYFMDTKATYLAPEKRSLEVKDNDNIERIILSELIKGPKDKTLQRTIPADTRVLSVETKGGVCFVNFSKEFIDKFTGGSSAEILMVYSIINSLTELPSVDSVQILIGGEKVEILKSVVINEPFTRDEAVIAPAP